MAKKVHAFFFNQDILSVNMFELMLPEKKQVVGCWGIYFGCRLGVLSFCVSAEVPFAGRWRRRGEHFWMGVVTMSSTYHTLGIAKGPMLHGVFFLVVLRVSRVFMMSRRDTGGVSLVFFFGLMHLKASSKHPLAEFIRFAQIFAALEAAEQLYIVSPSNSSGIPFTVHRLQ